MNNSMRLEGGLGKIQAGPKQQARLSDVLERLSGSEFFITVSDTIPSQCIDGRVGAFGYAPNSAGGTLSLFVADDLTTKQYAGADGTTVSAYENVVRALDADLLPVGGHTDEHAGGEKSGCGANDRLSEIYPVIANQGNALRQLTSSLGVKVDDVVHDLIIKNASARTEFSSGASITQTLEAIAGDETVDPLRGEHNEVAAVINRVPETTLDRVALESAFGPTYESFNIDVWSFKNAAVVTSLTPEEAESKEIALYYYNLAAALVLCGPEMQVIIRG